MDDTPASTPPGDGYPAGEGAGAAREPGWAAPVPPPPPPYGAPPPPYEAPPPPYGAPPPPYGAPPQWGSPVSGVPGYGTYAYGTPGYGYGYAPSAPKPGIVALRPLSVGEILDGGFSTVRRHPRVVFGVALVLGAVTQLITFALASSLRDAGATTTVEGDRIMTVNSGDIAATVVTLVVSAILGFLLTGVVSAVVGKAILGQPVDGREVIGAAASRWLPLLVVGTLAGALPLLPALFLVLGPLGFIPFAVAAVYLWGQLALALPAFVLEKLGPIQALKRSWRLVRGAFWRTWSLRALMTIITGLAASVLALPFTGVTIARAFHGSGTTTSSLLLTALGDGLGWIITQPVLAATITLIYVDRRMRAEAFDMQLARAVQIPGPMSK